MRVLLIAENWPPRIGGIENYLTNIAKHLAPVSVTVVEPSTHKFFWPLIKPTWLPLYVFLHRLLKKEAFDAILCGKALFEGLLGYYLKKSLGIPYIVFTYAMEIETWSKNTRQKRQLERVLKNADRVIYINDVTKKSLIALGATEQQLVKIWPGVDERFFSPPYEGGVAEGRSGYILTVSRLIPRKGIDSLISAFVEICRGDIYDAQLKLIIAGDGPERAKLEALAKEKGVADRVKFLGFVPEEDLPALYANAEFFALTPKPVENDIEGFGIVYLEAAACGIPAIATSTGGAGEAVIHKETGLVVQPNVAAIKEALEYMLTNKDEARRLGEAAKKRALDQFRWSKRILLVKGVLDAITYGSR